MIALWGSDVYWQGVLRQEGVSFRTDVGPRLDGVKILILDRAPSPQEASRITDYVASGGALLGYSGHASAVWPELTLRPVRLRYIIPDGCAIFHNVGLVSVETKGLLCSRANTGRTNGNHAALLVDRIGQGARVLLPFDLARVFEQLGATFRQFPAVTQRFPTETVSTVSRGEVRRLVAGCLRLLLAEQGLPYVHLAYVPGPGPSVFGFRIDTDFGSKSTIESAARLADDMGIRPSWYVNVRAHGEYLPEFKRYADAGHDVQLHCYRHVVYRDYGNNRTNLERGRATMAAAGLPVTGTVAPYGDWNPEFDRALADLEFSYSSEFTFDFDDLPCRVVISGRPSPLLQVPVHPISIGRLEAAHASDSDVRCYYQSYAELQVSRQEPCFLYDHPEQISQKAEVLRQIIDDAVTRCGGTITLTDYFRWWRRREGQAFDLSADANGITVATANAYEDIDLVVEMGERQARLPLRNATPTYEELDWQEILPAARFDTNWIRAGQVGPRVRIRELRRSLLKRLQERQG